MPENSGSKTTDPPQPTAYDDDYPADWNRIYKGGDFIKAFPPMVDGGGNRWIGCSFYNCTVLEAPHD